MIFLIAVVIGILLGVAMGGRISSLPSLRLRGIWLVLLALIAQFVIFVPVFSERPLLTTGAAVFHIASYVLILGFLVWNRRVRPLIALGLGAVCNFLAIAANGGLMPASATALRSAGLGRAADRLLADGSLGNVVLMGETTRFDALRKRRHRRVTGQPIDLLVLRVHRQDVPFESAPFQVAQNLAGDRTRPRTRADDGDRPRYDERPQFSRHGTSSPTRSTR